MWDFESEIQSRGEKTASLSCLLLSAGSHNESIYTSHNHLQESKSLGGYIEKSIGHFKTLAISQGLHILLEAGAALWLGRRLSFQCFPCRHKHETRSTGLGIHAKKITTQWHTRSHTAGDQGRRGQEGPCSSLVWQPCLFSSSRSVRDRVKQNDVRVVPWHPPSCTDTNIHIEVQVLRHQKKTAPRW